MARAQTVTRRQVGGKEAAKTWLFSDENMSAPSRSLPIGALQILSTVDPQ
jgi:hypothetical protein